jgi:hypothetical protein
VSSYSDSGYCHGPGINEDPHDWRAFTQRRLAWLYGPERADFIESGRDPKTLADLLAWRKLGRRDAA